MTQVRQATIAHDRHSTEHIFANNNQTVCSWYVVARSKEVRQGDILSRYVLGRQVGIWRRENGQAMVFDPQCPHFGADLSDGSVINDSIQCPFHHWRYDGEGRCIATDSDELPERCLKIYPSRENHGLIWMYNGSEPAFELPELPPDANQFRRWLPPKQKLNCHPHLIIGNGMDARHFVSLHGLQLLQPAVLKKVNKYVLQLSMTMCAQDGWLLRLLGIAGRPISSSFTTYGSSIAWATVSTPLPIHVLFTARPEVNRSATTQTVFYLPKGYGLREVRAGIVMMRLLHADRRVLERLQFRRGFTDLDDPFHTFVQTVDSMVVEQ